MQCFVMLHGYLMSNKLGLCPRGTFKPSLIFASKAGANTKDVSMDKHSSLFVQSVTNEEDIF
jgi:hypothetical protein